LSVLDRLASEVRSRGGLLASEVSPASADGRLGAVVAAGPPAGASSGAPRTWAPPTDAPTVDRIGRT
jgi:hypothetical protein